MKNKEEDKIKFIQKFFGTKIKLDEDLFASGRLDSLKVVELISLIEKKTKKKINPKKINQKTFSKVQNILKLF